ncbi:MAG: SCO family protein [Vicinamibacterales bacterium]
MRRYPLAALVVAAAVAAACATEPDRQPGDGLPFYDSADFTPRWARDVDHVVGDFALVTQTGEPLTGDDLAGRIHVASFIYTKCAGICPTMVRQLSTVEAAVADDAGVVLVSYSVTPQDDTPEALATFGADRGIDPDRWKLVTGDPDTIYRLAHESYFADDGRLDPAQPATAQFLHTEKVLLVDARGRLRGVYNGTLPYDMAKLVEDVSTLEREAAAGS